MTENKLQNQCYLHWHNTYPHLRGLLCYNLNNSRNLIDGNRNKAMGLQAGRADMVLYYRGQAVHIEFKLPGESQSKAQREWQDLIQSHGFRYEVVSSVEQFQRLIQETTNQTTG